MSFRQWVFFGNNFRKGFRSASLPKWWISKLLIFGCDLSKWPFFRNCKFCKLFRHRVISGWVFRNLSDRMKDRINPILRRRLFKFYSINFSKFLILFKYSVFGSLGAGFVIRGSWANQSGPGYRNKPTDIDPKTLKTIMIFRFFTWNYIFTNKKIV